MNDSSCSSARMPAHPVDDPLAAPGVQAQVGVGQAALLRAAFCRKMLWSAGPSQWTAKSWSILQLVALALEPVLDRGQEVVRAGRKPVAQTIASVS